MRRLWERRLRADDEGGEGPSCSSTDGNTSSANASTSSSTAASSGARRGGGAAEGRESSPRSAPTINLSQEYRLAIHTQSYQEIWDKIHVDGDGDEQREEGFGGDGEEEEEEGEEGKDRVTLAGVLRPEDTVVERALADAPDTELTRLAADYFRSTHHASLLCLSLRRALRRARALYGPITDLLALIPHSPQLAVPHRDCAFDAFVLFDKMPNPFPGPAAGFQGMQRSFFGLKNHLDLRLLSVRRRRRWLRCAKRGSGICLIACATGAAVAGLVLATHAITALLATAPACAASSSCCPLAASMKHLQKHMERLDATARGTYVLNNDVATIERLVGRLHATVESDKMLVRLGLEHGRGQHHTIEEVVRQLRKNHPSLLRQLADLEEHICLYFAAVNRARLLLVHHLNAQSDAETESPLS